MFLLCSVLQTGPSAVRTLVTFSATVSGSAVAGAAAAAPRVLTAALNVTMRDCVFGEVYLDGRRCDK